MLRRGIDRRRDGTFRVRLPRSEREVLAAIPGQLREAIAADDPSLFRLFPPAFADDDEANEEYARLVGSGLVEGKVLALAELERTAFAEQLTEDELRCWLGGLESLRLVPDPLVVRLDPLPPGFVLSVLDRLTARPAGAPPVIESPEQGWARLRLRLADDLERGGVVLPQQLKVALMGLTRLKLLSAVAYDQVGGVAGLDDVLDYKSDPATRGKNLGDDLAEGKPTLPLLHALRHGNDEQRALIRLAIEQGGLAQLGPIVEAIETTGGLDYATSFATRETREAVDALAPLPDSPFKRALTDLARFALERTT